MTWARRVRLRRAWLRWIIFDRAVQQARIDEQHRKLMELARNEHLITAMMGMVTKRGVHTLLGGWLKWRAFVMAAREAELAAAHAKQLAEMNAARKEQGAKMLCLAAEPALQKPRRPCSPLVPPAERS